MEVPGKGHMCVLEVGWAEDTGRFQYLHAQAILGSRMPPGLQQDNWDMKSRCHSPPLPQPHTHTHTIYDSKPYSRPLVL